MFNFMNIDEIEFEEICKEILEIKTGMTFRTFSRGPDGGIDIQANNNENIIGQVKFYLNTSQADTINKLNREFRRIENKNIDQYYIFIGREMSPQNINKIFEKFKGILKSKEHIFTLKEINELLNEDKYSDIVKKHIKLWVCSTGIIEEINTRDVFIDCEILLHNIRKDVDLFVQTELYNICKRTLDESRLLLILGMPGIGKTTLSKMLALNYAQNGYCIKYTTSSNLQDIKKALSIDRSKRELIYIDDCLGQTYLELQEKKENDIINLIKYVQSIPNKMLLLNSRITIFQEAKNRQYEIVKCMDGSNLKINVIDIENISRVEKARILHQHLVVKKVPEQ